MSARRTRRPVRGRSLAAAAAAAAILAAAPSAAQSLELYSSEPVQQRPVRQERVQQLPVQQQLGYVAVTVLAVVPAAAVPGDTVTVVASAPVVAAKPGGALPEVRFGDRAAEVVGGTDARLDVVVPAGLEPGSGDHAYCVYIISEGARTEPFCQFEVLAARAGAPFLVNRAGLIALVLGLLLFSGLGVYGRRQRLAYERRLAEAKAASARPASAPRRADPQAAEPAAPPDPIPLPDPPAALVDAVAGGRCMLFAGGGIGAQAGVPTWLDGLVQMWALSTGEPEPSGVTQVAGAPQTLRAGDALAELLAARNGREQLMRLVQQVFATPAGERAPFLELLGEIPFAGAITANWDDSLERAFADRAPRLSHTRDARALAAHLRESAFTIVKLWGDPRDGESFVFTPQEYRRITYDNEPFGRAIASVFLERTLFFVGTSLAGINDFLSALPVREPAEDRMHFALVPWAPDVELQRELLRGRYGVELLVYSPGPGYPEVAEFFRKLRGAVAAAEPVRDIQPATLHRVVLRNIGAFEELALELQPGWNVLLGNNGCGKSTVLRAIALGLCGHEARERAARAAASLLRAGEDHGRIELFVGSVRYRTDLIRERDAVRIESRQLTPLQAGRWVVLGFPPLRGVSTRDPDGPSSKDAPDYPVVDDLLPLLTGTIDSRLDNLKQWIVNTVVRGEGGEGITAAEAERHRRLGESFFRLVDRITPGERLRFSHVDKRTWRVMVTTDSGVVPIDLISQGMSSMMAWVGVLLLRMYEIHGQRSEPEREGALVLVDEIDAHMHPEWQRTVVQFVREHFPNLQVIATTHSPLVIGTMRAHEVTHVRRSAETGQLELTRSATGFRGLRADQILTSAAFDLETTLDTETSELIEEYARLLGVAPRSAAQDARMRALRAQLGTLIPRHAETEQGRQAAELLERWLDDQLNAQPPEQVRRIKQEAAAYLAEIMPEAAPQAAGSLVVHPVPEATSMEAEA